MPSNPQPFEFAQVLMGVPMRIVIYADDEATAAAGSSAAFARIRKVNDALSDYEPDNELAELCKTAGSGRAVSVSDDLWNVLAHSTALAERSGGAFDATVSPVVKLWRKARRQNQLPPEEQLRAALALVDYRQVRLDTAGRTVELAKPGVKLDFGGVAKGYAMDRALETLRCRGLTRVLVEAGGDVGLGDPPPGRPGWRIALAPREKGGTRREYLVLSNGAVATSGDAFQYVDLGGRRYSHVVDPRTGMGLTDRTQVTVVAPDGLTADGLSTAVNALGPEKGLELIDATPGAAAFIVRAGDDTLETFVSSRFKDLAVETQDEPCATKPDDGHSKP